MGKIQGVNIMTNIGDDYTQLLRMLLPPDRLAPHGMKKIRSLKGTPSLAQAHENTDSLIIKINPAQSVELINRYKKLCGLPDKCLANTAKR